MRKDTDDDEYIYIYELTKIRELKKLVSNSKDRIKLILTYCFTRATTG